eukprot:gene14217-16768_t
MAPPFGGAEQIGSRFFSEQHLDTSCLPQLRSVFFFLVIKHEVTTTPTVVIIYVASKFHAPHCGSILEPCQSIRDSIGSITSNISAANSNRYVINVKRGLYDGFQNREISLSNLDVTIRSQVQHAVIDCQKVSFGLLIKNSIVKLSNIIFINCIGIQGGALSSYNSTVSMDYVKFYSNFAENGAAGYFSTSDLTCNECTLSGNTANQHGSALSNYDYDEDIYFYRSKGTFVKSNTTSMGVACDSSSVFSSPSGKLNDMSYDLIYNLCDIISKCKKPLVIDTKCPTCQFQGVAFSLYDSTRCPLLNEIPNLFSMNQVHGNMSAYIKVGRDAKYQLSISGSNLGVNVYVNNLRVIISNSVQANLTLSHSLRLKDKVVNSIVVSIFTSSYPSSSSSSGSNTIQPYYSQAICGDGIIDLAERCNDIGIMGINIGNPHCGDRICNEVPEKCLIDCYDVIGTQCSSQVDPIKNDIPIYDTIAHLLNNQFKYSIPGLGHLSHGVDYLTFEEMPTQIFDSGYCDNFTYSTIQDTYRSRFYNVPPDFYAESLPVCTYDSQTNIFKSSQSYNTQKVVETTMDVEVGVDVKVGRFGGAADFAMSKSTSTDTAHKMQGEKSGQTVSTTVKCITTTVTRNDIRFHKNFVKDISVINHPNTMAYFIMKYGVFYYSSTSLGGSLELLIFVDSSANVIQDSETIKKQSEISGGGSFTTPYGGGGAKYSGSDDSEFGREEQEEFESEVSKSSVLVKGGALGSFGPDYSAPSSFGDWAQSVDLRPVPIDPKLNYIGNIIPESWTVPYSNSSCLAYSDKCTSYNVSNPTECLKYDNQTTCTVTETNPCTDFVTCTLVKVNHYDLSVKRLWREGFDIYLESIRNQTENRVELYNLKTHFIFKVNPPSTPADITKLSNLTIALYTVPGDNATTTTANATVEELPFTIATNVTIPIMCVQKDNGCQFTVPFKNFPHTEFELDHITITSYDATTKKESLIDLNQYFSQIFVESTSPIYSRGYIFNMTHPYVHEPQKSEINRGAETIVNETTTDNNNNNHLWIGPLLTQDPDEPSVTIITFKTFFNETTPNGNNTFKSVPVEIVNTTRRSQPIPDSLPVIYPDPGQTRFYFTTIDLKVKSFFSLVTVGNLGVNSYRVNGTTDRIRLYEEVRDKYVGTIEEFQMVFNLGDTIPNSKDDVFIMWVCPTDSNETSYSECVFGEQLQKSILKTKGFINLTVASFPTKVGRYLDYTIYDYSRGSQL